MLRKIALSTSLLSVCLGAGAIAVGSGARVPPWMIALSAGTLNLTAGPTTPATFDNASDQSTTIPFELFGNKIFLAVSVKGSEPLSFILDTGNKWAVINLARARSLGLHLGGDITVAGEGEKTGTGSFVEGERFGVVGLKSFSQPLFLAIPLDDIATRLGHRIDGLLGTDFIRQFVVDIDWIGKRLTLRGKAAFSYAGKGVSLPVTFDARSHPLVKATVQLGPGREAPGIFLVDIGSNRALALNSPFVKQEGIISSDRAVLPLRAFGAGGSVRGVTGRIDGLKIGGWVLKRPVAAFSQDEKGALAGTDKQGSIGVEVLRRFRVIFDFERDRIILEPNARFDDPFEHDMSGVALEAIGPSFETLRVVALDDGSPAAALDMKVGDVVTTINGRPASAIGLSEIKRLFSTEGRYEINLQRGEALIAVTLVTTRRL